MDVISPLTVEKVVYGGEGLCRHEGRVIFVPFTIKGEQISAKITKAKKNFAVGECIRIIHKDPARIQPLCKHFGFCGGCQFQHMNYNMQLQTKKDILQENIQHLFDPNLIDIVGIPDAIWEYRQHIKLTFENGKLGYHGLFDKDVFELKMCPIFSERLPELLEILNKALLLAHVNHADIRILKSNDQFIATIKYDKGQLPHLETLLPHFKGLSLMTGNHRKDYGDCSLYQNYLGLNFHTDIWSFMQNHRQVAELLYQHVVDSIPHETHTLLDLYCGAGILSILSAQKGIKHITGIELNPSSIACALKNSKLLPDAKLNFYAAPAEQTLKYAKQKPDFIIVNPPREGLSHEMLQELHKIQTKHICYVSCNPTTLSRDLKIFKGFGFEVISCKGFDMFPQTTHLETVCIIKKR